MLSVLKIIVCDFVIVNCIVDSTVVFGDDGNGAVVVFSCWCCCLLLVSVDVLPVMIMFMLIVMLSNYRCFV